MIPPICFLTSLNFIQQIEESKKRELKENALLGPERYGYGVGLAKLQFRKLLPIIISPYLISCRRLWRRVLILDPFGGTPSA